MNKNSKWPKLFVLLGIISASSDMVCVVCLMREELVNFGKSFLSSPAAKMHFFFNIKVLPFIFCGTDYLVPVINVEDKTICRTQKNYNFFKEKKNRIQF